MTPKPPIPTTLPDLMSLTASAGLPMTLSMTSPSFASHPADGSRAGRLYRNSRRQSGWGSRDGASKTESGLASRSSNGVRYWPDSRS